MNTNEDQKWQSLLARSAQTFAGEAEPPYGLVTGTLAQLRAEKGEQAQLEQIGWRALLASLAVLAIAATVTLSMNSGDRNDFEPGVNSLVQVENFQVS
jgi:hypothetical protein